MKPKSQVGALPLPNNGLCTSSPEDASRVVAWVSAAGAIVWGVTLAGFVGPGGLSIGSSDVLLFMLLATVLHIGQAFSSAISFKLGALFAAVAFVIAAVVLIRNPMEIVALTTPLVCSGCALFFMRHYTLANRHENAYTYQKTGGEFEINFNGNKIAVAVDENAAKLITSRLNGAN